MQRKKSATPKRRRRTRTNGLKQFFTARALGEWALPMLMGVGVGYLDEKVAFWRSMNPVFKVVVLVAAGVVARNKGKREWAGALFALAGNYGPAVIKKAMSLFKSNPAPAPTPQAGIGMVEAGDDLADAIEQLDAEARAVLPDMEPFEVAGIPDDGFIDEELAGLVDDFEAEYSHAA